MQLVAFGDSFIFGSDLKDCNLQIHEHSGSASTWPRLLAKKLDTTSMVFAQPGAGNQAIADDVLRVIANFGNTVLYSIHWTWIDRFDYVHDKQYYNKANGLLKADIWSSITPGSNLQTSAWYYKNIHHEYVDKIRNLGLIYQTIQMLECYDCVFHMTYMDNLLLDTKYYNSDSVTILQKHVKHHLQNYNGVNFLDWAKQQKYAISAGWHPLEQAHQAACDYWLPTYAYMLNTGAKEE